MGPVHAVWLGRAPYAPVHALQEALVAARIRGEVGDTLLLLEHEPVITLGRGAKVENVLWGSATRDAQGIDYVETGRGGDVTYHAPGQLVAYPIFDLRPDRCDVRRYVRDLGKVMTAVARTYGVAAELVEGDPKLIGVWVDLDSPAEWRHPVDINGLADVRLGKVGVWVDAEAPAEWAGAEWARSTAKLGAIGVRLSRWVTMHGFALNVSTDLSGYQSIVACGIKDRPVASLASVGADVDRLARVADRAARAFGEVFGVHVSFEDVADSAHRGVSFSTVPFGPWVVQ
jgi:lipoyl(octanoyl) transferase